MDDRSRRYHGRLRSRRTGRRGLALPALAFLTLAAASGCERSRDEADPSESAVAEAAADEWLARRAALEATVWADEKLAEEYERSILAFWDALLDASRSGNPERHAEVFREIPLREIRVGRPRTLETLDHGIEHREFAEPFRQLSPDAWRELVANLSDRGWRFVQSDWHHLRFDPPAADQPARSRITCAIHLEDPEHGRRLAAKGHVDVEWSAERDARGLFTPDRIDTAGLQTFEREGPAPFARVWAFRSPRRDDPYAGVHPVLLHDLDEDGLIDLVLLRSARVVWNRGEGRFEDEPLFADPPLFTEAGVIADLDGDGHSDLLASRARGDLVMHRGTASGRFDPSPLVTSFDPPLRAPSAISVGDVDGDGDLDAWLAQYKPAYEGGQMPHPFYDANDGHPSYLLVNDGSGGFSQATEEAGLAAKRFRRTYAAALVDLDDDGDLDLLVVSDYSGIDLYRNDGRGRFTDANDSLDADRHLFGMSSSFGDFDLDGDLDFFVAGMSSTTARRLEALGLAREDRPDVTKMRMRMAWGNRMYLADGGRWKEPAFAAEIARTGWTWGTTALDFDNDGDADLFAANGHVSGESTADYCATFWIHDIYDGGSEPDPTLESLFSEVGRDLRAGIASWDGFQKNALLMNGSGKGFVDVAWPLGVADEFDARSAVSADFDRDGRLDLAVAEDHDGRGETLHVYLNRVETGNDWIGVELHEDGNGVSPVGAAVSVRTPTRTQRARVMTGETLMGQHATVVHFGLGPSEPVETLEVRWPDGRTLVVPEPAAGRYHRVSAPERAAVP